MLTTPPGIPASSMASASSTASSTVSGLGFMTTVLPIASAGASLVIPRVWGKFHGTIAAMTPSDFFETWTVPPSRPGRSSSNAVVPSRSA
jgi:hypothetical protein